MIAGTQLIYRLKNAIRLLIDYRPGVDAFNFYWSATELGVYTLFAENLANQASLVPPTKGKVLFEFYPSLIVAPPPGWDNDQTNYIKMAEVIGGVIGPQEGPMVIPTRTELIWAKDQMVAYGFNKDSQKFIPLAVDSDGKLL